jgi:hypothetical protein
LINRADFIFTIGYEGNTAVVDGALKKRYGSLSTEQLASKGMFKQAVCAAVYEQLLAEKNGTGKEMQKSGGLQQVLEMYNRVAERQIGTVEELKRIFGVPEVPAGIGKVMVI